jgi:hypothetical protein
MEAEVSELVGADRRRARRAQPGAADASQRLSAAPLGHARRRARARDPEDPARLVLPELPRAAPAQRAGAGVGDPAGVRVRRLDAEGRSAGRVAWSARVALGGVADLRRPRANAYRAGRQRHDVASDSGHKMVAKIDNRPRVRDGYISESTCGHARALPTRYEQPICRTNVPANDRACTRLPPQNFMVRRGSTVRVRQRALRSRC